MNKGKFATLPSARTLLTSPQELLVILFPIIVENLLQPKIKITTPSLATVPWNIREAGGTSNAMSQT